MTADDLERAARWLARKGHSSAAGLVRRAIADADEAETLQGLTGELAGELADLDDRRALGDVVNRIMPAGVLIATPNGQRWRVSEHNPAAAYWLAGDPSGVLVEDLVPPEDRPAHLAGIARFTDSRELGASYQRPAQKMVLCLDGRIRPRILRGFHFQGYGDEWVGVVITPAGAPWPETP